MNTNERIIMAEAQRLGIEHAKEPDLAAAMKSAMRDLANAKDFPFVPVENPPTKMKAIDFLRLVAVVLPQLITEELGKELMGQFKNCNDASRIGIITILALIGRKESLPFIRDVLKTIPDTKDWVHETALEAVGILEGRKGIPGRNERQGEFIYRTIETH